MSKMPYFFNKALPALRAGERSSIHIDIEEMLKKKRIEIMKPKCFFFHGQHG